jgi:hypothetical protein
MSYLTEEATVTVNYPENLSVMLGPLGFQFGKELTKSTTSQPGLSIWRIDAPLLPGHGLTIKWQ